MGVGMTIISSFMICTHVTRSRRMMWVGHAACMEERSGEPEVKRPLEILRYGWEGNIKMTLQGVGCASVDWNALAEDKGTGGGLV